MGYVCLCHIYATSKHTSIQFDLLPSSQCLISVQDWHVQSKMTELGAYKGSLYEQLWVVLLSTTSSLFYKISETPELFHGYISGRCTCQPCGLIVSKRPRAKSANSPSVVRVTNPMIVSRLSKSLCSHCCHSLSSRAPFEDPLEREAHSTSLTCLRVYPEHPTLTPTLSIFPLDLTHPSPRDVHQATPNLRVWALKDHRHHALPPRPTNRASNPAVQRRSRTHACTIARVFDIADLPAQRSSRPTLSARSLTSALTAPHRSSALARKPIASILFRRPRPLTHISQLPRPLTHIPQLPKSLPDHISLLAHLPSPRLTLSHQPHSTRRTGPQAKLLRLPLPTLRTTVGAPVHRVLHAA
jgi:hypothetical protein